MTIPHAITNGQYADGNDLTLTISENGSPTTLQCKVVSPDERDCDWYMQSGSTPDVRLVLTRVKKEQVLESQKKKFGGTYAGSNADYQKITAQFKTVLEPQASSLGVPQVSIAGSFTFNGYSFNFKDSGYDPISNVLAISINGDNPIIVNCSIESEESLHCEWIGTHGATSNEDFDLTKAQ